MWPTLQIYNLSIFSHFLSPCLVLLFPKIRRTVKLLELFL